MIVATNIHLKKLIGLSFVHARNESHSRGKLSAKKNPGRQYGYWNLATVNLAGGRLISFGIHWSIF